MSLGDTFFTAVLLVTQMFFTVGANLLVKLGAERHRGGALSLASIADPLTLGGIACFGLSFVLYSLLLQRIPLNIAQCFLAFQYVLVIFAASFLLGEAVPLLRWGGVVMIIAGVGLVSLTL